MYKGLGQLPIDVSQNFSRLSVLIRDGIARASRVGESALVRKGEYYQRWLARIESDTLQMLQLGPLPDEVYRNTRIVLGNIYSAVIPWSKEVNLLAAPKAVEQEQAQIKAKAGSSFLDQVLVTMGMKSPESIYVPDIPGLDVPALKFAAAAPWLVPVGIGVLAFLFFKR